MEEPLYNHKSDIIRRWSDQARQKIASVDHSGYFELLNTFPQFLDELDGSLRDHSPRIDSSVDLARSHAKQRVSVENYSVDEMFAEYEIMRDCLMSVLDHDGILSEEEKKIIQDFVQTSRNTATFEFLRLTGEREREAKQEARTALKVMENLMASAPYGVAFLDLELRFEKINETLARINGRPVNDHIGRSIWDIVPDQAPLLEAVMKEIIRTGKPRLNIESYVRLPWDANQGHHLLTTFFAVEDGDHKTIGVALTSVTRPYQTSTVPIR